MRVLAVAGMMNAIEQIVEKLRKYPHLKFELGESSITVQPTSSQGFTVGLEITGSRHTVFFNGWHEDFQGQEEALDCFAFGLSDECRLKECRRGSFAYRWTVESKQNGEWVADSETGLFLFPFWKTKTVRYLQNDLITSAE
jgi:hypothetical protein